MSVRRVSHLRRAPAIAGASSLTRRKRHAAGTGAGRDGAGPDDHPACRRALSPAGWRADAGPGDRLLAGGETRGGVRAELWDPAANTVTVVPGPPRYERMNADARLLADGRVEIAGGTDVAGAPVPAAEIFDPDLSSFVSARSPADWLGPSA